MAQPKPAHIQTQMTVGISALIRDGRLIHDFDKCPTEIYALQFLPGQATIHLMARLPGSPGYVCYHRIEPEDTKSVTVRICLFLEKVSIIKGQ